MKRQPSYRAKLKLAFSTVFSDKTLTLIQNKWKSVNPNHLNNFNTCYRNTFETLNICLKYLAEVSLQDENSFNEVVESLKTISTVLNDPNYSLSLLIVELYALSELLKSFKGVLASLQQASNASAAESAAEIPENVLEIVQESFEAKLVSSGIKEKDRLKLYINWVHSNKTHAKIFNAPIINVCQSSGCGKSKIATDIMMDIPAVYVVIRKSHEVSGFPLKSNLAQYFYFEPNTENANVSDFVVFYFITVIIEIFTKFSVAFKDLTEIENCSPDEALKKLSKMFISNKFDLDFDVTSRLATLREALISATEPKALFEVFGIDEGSDIYDKSKKLSYNLKRILRNLSKIKNTPPLFILDEASLLTDLIVPGGLNMFRLFRRAINLISHVSNLVTLTLGTNSDVVDLNSSMTEDSFRVGITGKLIPPFILSRNWDIFFSPTEMLNIKIGYDSLQCGRLGILYASLGRALWSSVPFSYIPFLSNVKITNNSLESGQAYLAAWLVRIGITVNPSHVVCKHLVKSLMARIMYMSGDMSTLRVDYPSEPVLAFAARDLLSAKNSELLKPYYEALLKYVQSRALDEGRMAEVVSADITLQALAKAPQVEMKTWDWVEGLPEICKKDVNILEEKKKQNHLEKDEIVRGLKEGFEDFCRVVTLEAYVETKFGGDCLNAYIPSLLKSSFATVSHFVQMTRKYPFESVMPKDFVLDKLPLADPKYDKGADLCNILTWELLEIGVTRACGHIFPPSYFGLDYQFPITLNPDLVNELCTSAATTAATAVDEEEGDDGDEKDEQRFNPSLYNLSESLKKQKIEKPFVIRPGRPTYSFIGVQVKKAPNFGNVRPIVAKCAISNHLVRCGIHQANCPNDCKWRIPDQEYKAILGNGLAFLHIMSTAIDESMDIGSDPKVEIEIGRVDLCNLLDKANTRNDLRSLNDLKRLMKEVCPAVYHGHIDSSPVVKLKSDSFKDCRFIPDIYIHINLNRNLRVHHLVKTHTETKIIERMTVIESRGIAIFENVLPAEVSVIARQIIASDISIFDELEDRKTIKFREMVQNFTHCNNGGSNPIASNSVRTSYGLELIPDELPNYKSVKMRKNNHYYSEL